MFVSGLVFIAAHQKEEHRAWGMPHAPCRDAPWRVRVRGEGSADDNKAQMADAPRRVPTGITGLSHTYD